MQTNQFLLLKTKRFLPLFITQFLGAFNDNAFKTAVVILITYRMSGQGWLTPQVLVNFASGLFVLPYLLFSAMAGQMADKYERAHMIVVVKFAEIIIMSLAAIGFYLHSIPILLTVLFLIGTQATFFGPIKYAILPDQLAHEELIAGNGLVEAGTFLAILLGTMLAGLLILRIYGIAMVSIVIISLAIMGWASSWFIPATGTGNRELRVNFNIVTETWRVIQHSRAQWDVFLSILGISWFWFVGMLLLNVLSPYTKNYLGADERVVTLFITLFSVGIGIGSLLCNRLLKGKVNATVVPLGAIGMTVFLIDLFFASRHGAFVAANSGHLIGVIEYFKTFTHWRIMFDLLMIAVSSGIYIVPLYAIMQSRSPESHRARIIASNNILNSLFMVAAAASTGIALYFGATIVQIFLGLAILNLFVAIYICKLLPDFLIKSILKWILRLLYRVHVHGMENYENAGERVIIIANHTSFLDAALLATCLPDKLTFAINTFTAQKWWIRLFLLLVDAYQLDPTNPMAIKSLINYVTQNKKCVIFPEGRITVTGTIMKIYEGPGMIADKSGAKLLPIRIDGAQFSPFSRLRGKMKLQWFPKITLTIFPPTLFNAPLELKGRKRRLYISNKLYDLMTEMLFSSSPYQQTLFAGLLAAKATYGSNHIVAEDIERKPLTYQQLILRSFILGDYIARSSKHNENIGILLPNTTTILILFFALHAFGRIPAILNFSSGISNVLLACKTAQIKQIYTSQRFVNTAKLSEMVIYLEKQGIEIIYLENLRNKIGFIQKLKGYYRTLFPIYFYRHLSQPKPRAKYPDANSPAVILFTSGSEGAPKGVVLSHHNIQANRFQISSRVDFTSIDTVFNALPVFHSFGLTGGMLLPVLSGLKAFFYPSPLHYRIIPELAYDTNSTILFGTDTFLSGYAKLAHPYDFYSLRYIFAGAEKLKDETRKIWSEKFGVRIFEGYGVTEASPVLAVNTPMQNRPGTVGRLLPGIQFQLQPVPGITDGHRLIVKGPNIMLGYLNSTQPGVIIPPAENWYDTGDIVSMDEQGYITIKGRAKRFAKIGGEMVSLTAVENYLISLWPKFEHAVVSVPDIKKGEQLILATTNSEATREAIIAYAKANNIGELMIPKKIIIIENMPLLGTGKTDYVTVQKLVNNNFNLNT